MVDEKDDGAWRKELLALLKKAGVPDPEKTAEEFDLYDIDEGVRVSREVAKRVRDRVDAYAKLFEDLLQPDANLAAMNECSFFNDEAHDAIAKTYRDLMAIVRKYAVADLQATDDAYLGFAAAAVKDWNGHKKFLDFVAKRLVEGWSEIQTLHGEKGYFG